jgi:hypothetical protein
VVVRCQFILCPNLDLHEHSAENDLPRMSANHRTTVMGLNPIRLSDKHHDVLMDAASLREGLDYMEEIADSASELSNSDEETDDEDDDDSETTDYDE